ncbi:MAG: diguanylate cyclase [Alphaproteobacteria bacterium]
MTTPARIILLDDDPANAESLAESLMARGYEVTVAAGREAAVDMAQAGKVTVMVIDGSAVEDQVFLEALRQCGAGETLPVVLVGVGGDMLPDASAVSYLPRPYAFLDLLGRLRILCRLATMRDEILRRTETARSYGVGQGPQISMPNEIADAEVLLIRGDANLAAQAEAALGTIGKVTVVESIEQAQNVLDKRRLDAVIGAGGVADDFMTFSADARANPRLYNLPILMLDDIADLERPFRHGVSEVVAPRAAGNELAFRTAALVRQQRYRFAMQEQYREARHFATSDSLTGLYNHGFLHAHLSKRIDDARMRGRTLSVGYFDIFHMAVLNESLGYIGGDFVIRQVGEMIGNLVRAEDLPARYGGDDFCVVLPDTTYQDGLHVLQRIAGVINFTDFSVPRVNDPVSVNLNAGCATLDNDDTVESLIARARSQI